MPASRLLLRKVAGARRMVDSAAHLVDNVLPKRPIRQWVLSVPYPLRFLFATNPAVMSRVLTIVHRVINAFLVNEGAIAEQFIGQHLLELLADSPNRELNFWLREGRSNNAEVDYVVALNGQIVPIEVKAGATGSLKSLHQFMGEKQAPLAVRFHAGNVER